jgi:hypothetical protein
VAYELPALDKAIPVWSDMLPISLAFSPCCSFCISIHTNDTTNRLI